MSQSNDAEALISGLLRLREAELASDSCEFAQLRYVPRVLSTPTRFDVSRIPETSK